MIYICICIHLEGMRAAGVCRRVDDYWSLPFGDLLPRLLPLYSSSFLLCFYSFLHQQSHATKRDNRSSFSSLRVGPARGEGCCHTTSPSDNVASDQYHIILVFFFSTPTTSGCPSWERTRVCHNISANWLRYPPADLFPSYTFLLRLAQSLRPVLWRRIFNSW